MSGRHRQRDGADSDLQDQGYAQQHQHILGEPECGGPDGAVGVHPHGAGGGQFQAGDLGTGQRNV